MVIEPRDRHIDGLTNDATPGALDHQQIVEHPRSRALLFFILLLSVSPPPSRTQSARNHLLCTWLEADCYPGILPFLRPAVHRQYRPSRVPPSPSRTWSLRVYFASDWGIQHSSNYNKLNLWRKLDLSFLNQHLTTIFFAFFLMKKNKL